MTATDAPNDPTPGPRPARRGLMVGGVVALSVVMIAAGVGIGAAIWSGDSSNGGVTASSDPAALSNAAATDGATADNAAATDDTTQTTLAADGTPILQDHWRSRDIQFKSAGRVNITRKWDAFNNCAHDDGSQYMNLDVKSGTNVTLGFTTVSDGSCFYESSKMHWQVTRLDSSGKPTGDTADVSLKQQPPPRVLDYLTDCEGQTGSMKCQMTGIIGTNLVLTF